MVNFCNNDEDDDNVPLRGLLPQIQPQYQGKVLSVKDGADEGEESKEDEVLCTRLTVLRGAHCMFGLDPD